MKRGGILALLVSASTAVAQLQPDLQRSFEQAEHRIVRLPPTAFPELPSNIIQELQHRGCKIPQETYSKRRNNVIQGSFAKPGQTDWAVLCSVKGTSSILVFWGGSERSPAEVAGMKDIQFLQGDSDGRMYYSRGISPVGRDFIMGHYRAYGGRKPPPIDHQGIDDAFIEKASLTYYFYEGKWLKLTGAD